MVAAETRTIAASDGQSTPEWLTPRPFTTENRPRSARAGCPWVFPNQRGDGPTSIVPQRWHEIRRWAALPDVRLHDLRHSFASVAINEGAPLVMIGRLLGHALPETTTRYAHLEDGSV